MNLIKKAAAVAAGAVVGAQSFAVPADADPLNDPCGLAITFLCRFMPMAPTLDHDVDLTQGPATINGSPLQQLPSPPPAPKAPPPSG